MNKIFPTVPAILVIVGAVAIFFSVRGVFVDSIPFVGRNDVVYSISSYQNEYLFWFVEVFYLGSGVAFIIYGSRQIKKNKNKGL